MSDPAAFFGEVAAAHRRCVWLDGGGAREWSGRRSIVGWLEEDDVSLTYDAARREVRRHAAGRSEVVGDDIWAVLEAAMAPGEQWFGYLGAACRPDLPARPDPDLPDAAWSYPDPIPENPKIRDLVCFYNERVDIFVDDVLQDRSGSGGT